MSYHTPLFRTIAASARQQQRRNVMHQQMRTKYSRVEPAGESVWQKVSIACGPVLGIWIAWMLINEKHEHHETPEYSYMRIRSKSFPWGDEALLEKKADHH